MPVLRFNQSVKHFEQRRAPPPNGGGEVECSWGMKNHDFRPLSRFVSEMNQDYGMHCQVARDLYVTDQLTRIMVNVFQKSIF